MGKKNRHIDPESLPERLPVRDGQRLVEVFVEGYDDVAFWRGVFNDFESERATFEISVPPRPDLAKGKRVVLDMVPESSPVKLLCVDSDFDYLFAGKTAQSQQVIGEPYVFHTYTYATENYLCYAPSLYTVCTKATKNDTRIFDFERFLERYSEIIYPAFAWYAYSAMLGDEHVFKLIDFKNTVRLHYLEVENGGEATLEWLTRHVEHKTGHLTADNPGHRRAVERFMVEAEKGCGLERNNTYLFMHGHTLMDNVVMPMLNAVCEKLRLMAGERITTSTQRGVALGNEISNYRNSLLNLRDTLVYNEDYKSCSLYKQLSGDIERMLVKSGLK